MQLIMTRTQWRQHNCTCITHIGSSYPSHDPSCEMGLSKIGRGGVSEVTHIVQDGRCCHASMFCLRYAIVRFLPASKTAVGCLVVRGGCGYSISSAEVEMLCTIGLPEPGLMSVVN